MASILTSPHHRASVPGGTGSTGVNNPSARVEHEATTTKVGEDQLFYCMQRGISEEDAVAMIINGFCKVVLSELPLEFSVEARKLLGISLEGSVG